MGSDGARTVRWTEVDRWGTLVSCANETWARKLAQRPELARNEDAVRETVRDPDAVLFDDFSTARREALERSPGFVMHYIGGSRAREPHGDKLVCVVVKWLPTTERTTVEGFVSTAYLAADLQPRLTLFWEREP
jgi:hypothetical protein